MNRSLFSIVTAAVAAAAFTCLVQAQQAPPAAGAGAPPAGRGAAGNFGGAAGRGGGRGGFGAASGPPAPVPPEVAIPRPSAEELTRLNEAVQHLVDADTSPTKALLQKYQSLLTITAPRPNPAATFTQTQQRMGPRHEGFVALAKKGDIDLLLEGDSITDFWNTQAGPPTEAYKKYFGAIKTADFAISGDTTQGVLWGLHNGEGQGFQPKAIMLMIGTNNIVNNTAPEIAEGIGAIILENRKDFPNAKILLLAVFPRGLPADPNRAKIAEINKIISKLDDHQHVFYMDIGSKFLDPATGAFLPDAFRPDNLHPLEKGYDIWGAAVKDILDSFLK